VAFIFDCRPLHSLNIGGVLDDTLAEWVIENPPSLNWSTENSLIATRLIDNDADVTGADPASASKRKKRDRGKQCQYLLIHAVPPCGW
jgi:hypothetical protein